MSRKGLWVLVLIKTPKCVLSVEEATILAFSVMAAAYLHGGLSVRIRKGHYRSDAMDRRSLSIA